MSIKSIDDDVEKKTLLNMSIFFLNVSIVRSLNLRMSILKICRNKWFFSFAHFVNRHRLIKMSIVFLIFWRQLIFLTFWMIFCFWSFIFIYFDQSFKFWVNDQRRLNRRMFLTTSAHSLIQKNLAYRLNIAQNTIFFIIDCKNFWTSHTHSSISRIDDERDKVDAFFSASLIFFKSIDFHVLWEIRNEFDSISQNMRIEIDMWFDDWFKSNLVVQCFNLSIKWIVINVKSMMLVVMQFSHVINFLNNVNVKSCSFIMFKSSFVVACCVDFDVLLQKKWWRLKFSNKMWWFVSASTRNFFVFENVNELFRDEWKMSEKLYTLWICIVLESSFKSLIFIFSVQMSIVKYSTFQLFVFSLSLT
jgi:hypothetical protein